MGPLVLLTADVASGMGHGPGPRARPRRPASTLALAYVEAVVRAGGVPVALPPVPIDASGLLRRVDAVVLTGGAFDIHPSWYDEPVTGRLDRVVPERTRLELELAREALACDVPVLGICGGMQAMAVAAGGSLIQDLPPSPSHEQPTDPIHPWHSVTTSDAARPVFDGCEEVNSTHHQAVRDPGALTACGWAPDGVIEVLVAPGHRFAIGVQWHPELLGDDRPYRALVAAATGSTVARGARQN